MIRVLLVDDHAVVRMGFRLLLQSSVEITVVGEADSGESACQLFLELAPDVVVMDLAMPGMVGLEALRRILSGVSCAAVGLLIAVVFRMMMPLIRKHDWVGLMLLAAVFIAIGVLRLPLPAVLLVAIPLNIAITLAIRRRVAA